VETDIDAAVILGVAAAALLGPVVVRRVEAADEGDYGEAVLPTVAQRIDIPPEITTRRDGLVKPR
ncbi:MAG: hypothetical protein RL676_1020, partial [Pseudomonadota bacterium]